MKTNNSARNSEESDAENLVDEIFFRIYLIFMNRDVCIMRM